jgi:dipeptidyl aminopeptidase/acylaminoacyl peptidase
MLQRYLSIFIAVMSSIVAVAVIAVIWLLVLYPTRTATTASSLIPDWVAITAEGELQLHHNGYTRVLRRDAVPEVATLPVVSADGMRIAYLRHDAAQVVLSVFVLADGTLIDVYRADDAIPRMIHWSPNGQYLAFATTADAVMVVASDGTQPATKVAHGALAFMDWAPTSDAVLVRLGRLGRDGGLLGVYDVAQQRIMVSHSDVGDFQSAQWDDTGNGYYYVVDAGINDQLSTSHAVIRYQQRDGMHVDIVDEGLATIRLLPAPQSAQLAYIVSRGDARELRIWRNGQLDTIATNQPLTAWWSPDARMLATLTVVDDTQLRWEVIDVTSGTARVLSTFTPNDSMIDVLRYFDGESFTPWSGDGRWLLTTTRDIVQAQAVTGGSVVPLGPGMYAQWMSTDLVP